MSHLTVAASEPAFQTMFDLLVKSIGWEKSDSANFGPFTAGYHIKGHLEGGSLDYETYGWLALLGPAGMPQPIVDKLHKALEEAVNDPTVRGRFVEQGAEPVSPGPEELKKFIASETAKWKAIIEKAGIEPN